MLVGRKSANKEQTSVLKMYQKYISLYKRYLEDKKRLKDKNREGRSILIRTPEMTNKSLTIIE